MKKLALKMLFKKWAKGGFTVVFWDGEQDNYGDEAPTFKLIFNKEPSLKINGDDIVVVLGEAYMDGTIDFEGSLDDILSVIALNEPVHFTKMPLNSAYHVDSKIQQRNIHHHYDLGNDFFSLWLDKTMSYSCAYFKSATDSLYQAQLQKIDHILKKINLKAGERLLDIGSGWGWLIIRAAQQYQVKATGITLSTEQYEGTQRRIKELGLEELVDVQLVSYQDMDASHIKFDKIVSVGMLEHVGQHNIGPYLHKANELLVTGGKFLLHSITSPFEEPGNSWMTKYIFPGGYVPSLREVVWQLPEHDFHLLHAESLRLHYALTLDQWYKNFSQHIEKIKQQHGEEFVRMWGLYLQGCAAAFRVSGLDIHQLLLTKGLNNQIPLTYEHLYQ